MFLIDEKRFCNNYLPVKLLPLLETIYISSQNKQIFLTNLENIDLYKNCTFLISNIFDVDR